MNIKLLELFLVLGVVLGLGLWQLYDVNKALKEEPEEKGSKDSPAVTDTDSDSNS